VQDGILALLFVSIIHCDGSSLANEVVYQMPSNRKPSKHRIVRAIGRESVNIIFNFSNAINYILFISSYFYTYLLYQFYIY
jgi:hypothetical protein